MKWLLAGGLSAATLGLIGSGALDSGRVYDLPVAEARQRLLTLEIPDAALASSGVMRPVVIRTAGERSVRWQLRENEGVSLLYVAELEPVGDARTRVRLVVRRHGGSSFERISSTRFMQGFNTASFAEGLDARLQSDPERRLNPVNDWAESAAADPEQVRELGAAVQSMFADVSEEVRNNSTFSERARRQRADSLPVEARMEAATRPMIDPTPTN